MTPFLQFLFVLMVLLFIAKAAGYLSTLARQPSVLGEMIVGLLLGPSLLNLLELPFLADNHLLGEMISGLAELGVLLLMFVAGLELHLSELARSSKVSVYAGVLGVVFPVTLGALVSLPFGSAPKEALFMGLTLGATSVSISAQTLMEINALRSRVGLGLLGAAVFDDILVILLLSAFLAVVSGAMGVGAILLIFGKMVLFFALSAVFGVWLLPRIVRLAAGLPVSQSVLSLSLVVMFLYGLAAELVGGMAAITGTFLAGLMFARTPEKERLERGIHALAYSFFVPIFFVHIGMTIDLHLLQPSTLLFLLVLVVIAIFAKWLGSGIGARFAGYTPQESIRLGAGMVSRGEVGLILGTVGINEGLLGQDQFSALVGVVLLTTLVTPPLLRYLFSRPVVEEKKPASEIETKENQEETA